MSLARQIMEKIEKKGQVKGEDDIEKNPHTLIDQTIREINKAWKPGTLATLKIQQGDWQRMLSLEEEINKMAIAGNVDRLRKSLENYKGLFLDCLGEKQRSLF